MKAIHDMATEPYEQQFLHQVNDVVEDAQEETNLLFGVTPGPKKTKENHFARVRNTLSPFSKTVQFETASPRGADYTLRH